MMENDEIKQPNEEELIQSEFEALLDEYRKTNHRQKIEIITKAYNFAKAAHKGIKRRSGEPYIMHPIRVARIVVSEIGLGSTSICSALLHDVVEDTDYTTEDIANIFGEKIAQIVGGLTKISGGVFAERSSEQAENFRRLILTMSEDIRVILIKIADRLHNMRTLGSMPEAKQYKITGETQNIYAPLAHRLGLFRIKNELENLSFKYEHPEIFDQLEQKLAVDEEARKKFFVDFSAPIKEKLGNMGYNFFLKERIKTVYSIWSKMTIRNISFEEVYDVLALRIVFTPKAGMSEKDQCWLLYSAITEIYRPHPERIRDWVSTPKTNGYEALHITVMGQGRWVEIQIRSERMNDIAEKGLAAHWKYKNGEEDINELDKWMKTIKELLENPEPNAIDFMDSFKLNLFATEIFVFTPQGEIKTISLGATALDFAFHLHSDLGSKCIGAKVNHKLVPLNYKLNSGDQIEILTSKKQTPQVEWLEYVSTARAKSKLKLHFKREEKQLIATGQSIYEEILSELKLKSDNETVVKLLNYFKLSKPPVLYLNIGKGLVSTDEIKLILKPKTQNVFAKYLKMPFGNSDKKPAENALVEIKPNQKIDRKKTFILTAESVDVNYVLALCCRPIPGDDVLGYVDEDEMLIIHKRQCAQAADLKVNFGNRLVSAQWATHKMLSFSTVLEIVGIDKKGVMIEILKVISEKFDGNISKISIDTEGGIFTGRFNIYVHDTEDIMTLCKNIKQIKEVSSVQRIES